MKKILIALFASALVFPLISSAATLSFGENVSEKSQEIRDNLYAAGGNVTIASVIFGDLTAIGGTVTISQNVSEDVAAAAGNLSLLGEVGGDARLLGGNVTINENVGGDLLVGAGTVNILPNVSISKDFVGGIGAGTIDGNILGNARIMGGNITLNGIIKGNASINVQENLSFGPDAKIEGNLSYSAPKKIEIPEGVVEGSVEFKQKEPAQTPEFAAGILAILGIFFIFKLLAFVTVAILLILFLPKITRNITSRAIGHSGKELIRGFVLAVALPIASILAFATIIGMAAGGLLFIILLFLFILSSSISGIAFGTFLAHTFFKSQSESNWKHALWGVVALQAIGLVPIVGWALKYAVFLITLGAASFILYKKIMPSEEVVALE